MTTRDDMRFPVSPPPSPQGQVSPGRMARACQAIKQLASEEAIAWRNRYEEIAEICNGCLSCCGPRAVFRATLAIFAFALSFVFIAMVAKSARIPIEEVFPLVGVLSAWVARQSIRVIERDRWGLGMSWRDKAVWWMSTKATLIPAVFSVVMFKLYGSAPTEAMPSCMVGVRGVVLYVTIIYYIDKHHRMGAGLTLTGKPIADTPSATDENAVIKPEPPSAVVCTVDYADTTTTQPAEPPLPPGDKRAEAPLRQPSIPATYFKRFRCPVCDRSFSQRTAALSVNCPSCGAVAWEK